MVRLYPNTIGDKADTMNKKIIPMIKMFLLRIMPPSIQLSIHQMIYKFYPVRDFAPKF